MKANKYSTIIFPEESNLDDTGDNDFRIATTNMSKKAQYLDEIKKTIQDIK